MPVKKSKSKTKKTTRSFKASDNFKSKLEKIIKEGNARRIVVKDKKNKIIAQFPLTFGVLGTILAPIFAAIAAVVALVKDCTITVEKK
ncbi:hypothetical protein A2313_03895 [Candidatus Roizmanbacteria bacterium RIFOXYB2_FULL_41_10]|uniref:DUF4342 domain-containing protein n=1 Tax=Candidatus Roizmanbacteria bacterium RIFOXYA1_FULL_41_12 TaxID=1802082 RepID=A0A1F7K269_9BACT|nr:MAG: hypothetical protein A2209_00540 [Candidatus Roizmanbacteria bacterium RIFOXYA1_FULL_41_12]OGK66611.1 MAG: hypothetical protein A2377_00290 [Candidatus Roizmanbacteria bacterium RIFOXYB1_FULL_41_27]OGK67142.1 MAG: hypothetical protein A2262_00905 [Candidatus Roizmanbacteria bacterium RIFOXYA2_FULL_41_8]OGK69251.1 MAG: hypothetical protein A2313_03895 [Candidatus Roizmanbacteria bacterium RIFOXYB2_FULL_41_10]OGK71007.1 MAG: hypothetical protein A2403_03865 [Candidatus Roizmanbacteria bac